MFQSSKRIAWLALGLSVAQSAAGADPIPWLHPQVDYAAHTVMQSRAGRLTGRVWASGPKERRELIVQGHTHTMIVRKDRGVAWVLVPEQQVYLEQPLGESGMTPDRFAGGQLVRDVLGTEVVNGAKATRYRVHGTSAKGEPFAALMWMTAQEIPVRVVTDEGDQRVEMELDELSVGAVDPSRFEIPSGYTRLNPGDVR